MNRLAFLMRELELQRVWVAEHGGTLDGYVARYGSREDPDHYGEGGEAIYEADAAVLRRLEEQVEEHTGRARDRPHVEAAVSAAGAAMAEHLRPGSRIPRHQLAPGMAEAVNYSLRSRGLRVEAESAVWWVVRAARCPDAEDRSARVRRMRAKAGR